MVVVVVVVVVVVLVVVVVVVVVVAVVVAVVVVVVVVVVIPLLPLRAPPCVGRGRRIYYIIIVIICGTGLRACKILWVQVYLKLWKPSRASCDTPI